MENKKILIVDDEKNIRDFVERNLTVRHYQVFSAATALEALAIFNTQELDLVILDIMMPSIDGLELCRRIRSVSKIPILALTALSEEEDKVRALDMGVDDYLSKPFGIEEFLARVRSVLRRVQWEQELRDVGILQYKDLQLDPESSSVERRGQAISLTRTEFNLLHFFMKNRGKALSHWDILKQVWGEEYGNEAEYLRVYIGRLRKKIESDPLNPEYLKTEHGLGYRFG